MAGEYKREDMYRQESKDRDFSSNGHSHLDERMDSDAALQRIKTAGSISLSPELFEKLYLSPQNNVKGDLRKTFGNPTPLALVGFLLALTPLACDLMGWRGANVGNGSTDIGAYFSFGAILMLLGAIGEWIVGNTFPFVVFASFSAFWFEFGALLDPSFGSITNYVNGTSDTHFNASFGFFLVWMGVLCFLYMILSLRTNVVFFGIFASLVLAFGFLTAAFWYTAQGRATLAGKMLVGGGACCFITTSLGWWIFFAIMLAALDFPFQLPVGDLSTFIKSASQRIKERDEMA